MNPSDFMQRYEAATRAHDLAGTLDLIADDAIYLFSDQTTHIGKPAIGRALATNFANIKGETYNLADLQWLATSDSIAACVYEFRWSGIMNGELASGQGRGTSVIRKTNGNWLVAHEHLSSGKL